MSRKPEQLVWDSLRLKSSGKILFQRHEDRFSAGIPDLSGVFRCVQFWCELKHADGSKRLLLRQRQLNWMLERSTRGVDTILLARRGPHEWAGCSVDESTYPELIRGVDFNRLAVLGRLEVNPVELIERLLHDNSCSSCAYE